MPAWPNEALWKNAESDDLHVSPLRDDGVTHGAPTWVWSVVVDGELYVRAYHGTRSRRHQAALRQKAGRIKAAGMDEGGRVRACSGRRADQRSHRRCLPRQVRGQLLSRADDQRTRAPRR